MLVGLLGRAVRNVEFYRQLNKEVSGNNMQQHDLFVVKDVPVMVLKSARDTGEKKKHGRITGRGGEEIL